MEPARLLSIGDRVPQGSTFPIYGTILTPEGERVKAIVKFPVIEKRVPPESILNEWVATRLAKSVGIAVADCWLVELGRWEVAGIEASFGIGVASSLCFTSRRTKIDPFVYPDTFAGLGSEDALRLFLFDLLFLNTDRIPENPNCGRAGERLFAYDFGSALPSPKTLPSRFDRAYFPPNLTERAESHLCRGEPMAPQRGLQVLTEMLDTVPDQGQELVSLLSPSSHADLLSLYFRFLSDERETIIRQISTVI